MIDQATLYMGQIRITAPGYVENPRTETVIPEDGLRARMLGERGVKGVAGRVRGFALLSCGEGDSSSTQPAEILGIDPSEERGVSQYENHVAAAVPCRRIRKTSYWERARPESRRNVGSEVVAMGQDAYGSVAAEVFTVCGIVDTGDPLRDVSAAIAGRANGAEDARAGGKHSRMGALYRQPADAAAFAERLAPGLAGLDILSWNRFLPS